jgi:hypothetical protein
MTKTQSPGTGEIPWTPDASLIDAAREIARIIREHSEEAERERRLPSQSCRHCARRGSCE